MNDSPESYKAPENRVKRLLDRCGTLLLRDVPRDERNTLSDYKEVMNDKREISLSDCPCGASFMINDDGEQALSGEHWGRARYEAMLERVDARAKPYEKKDREAKKEQKRARQTTKFSRIADIESKHPGCTCAGYRVDTDNEFDVCGIRYRISSTCEKYAPRHTRYGDQYDMDRVLVFTCPDGRLIFADQDGYLIDDG